MSIFHLAIKIKDIESTYKFYHEILKCSLGRSTKKWIDFNFFGHQLSAHISTTIKPLDFCANVENVAVPIPHFGCVLNKEDFIKVKLNLIKNDIDFVIKPQIRFKDQAGEQETMFVTDFSHNVLEFKTFKNPENIFL